MLDLVRALFGRDLDRNHPQRPEIRIGATSEDATQRSAQRHAVPGCQQAKLLES